MGNLKKDTFICLDVEATGLSTETDEIIELAIVKFTFDEIIDTFEALIDPKMPIPQEAIDVHHINNDMLVGKPPIEDILPEAFELIKNHIIVGHNIGYDLAMLMQAAKKRRIPCPIDVDRSIDTLRLAKTLCWITYKFIRSAKIAFQYPRRGRTPCHERCDCKHQSV